MDLIVDVGELDPADAPVTRRPAHPRVGGHKEREALSPSVLLAEDGTTVQLDVDRWLGEVDEVEVQLLASLADPVLDIGSGPGRIGAALSGAGRVVLGIDPAPTAVAWARERGAPTLCRSVFDQLPGEGRWASALLLDGNIGIGGDPCALLTRIYDLLAPGGEVVAELTAPGGTTGPIRVRLQGHGTTSARRWFPWARVSADAFPSLAERAGLVAADPWEQGGRWFARAARP